MPRGVPRAGFRMTKNRMSGIVNITKPDGFNTADATEVKQSRFSINERFGFVSDMVTMLAVGDQASVVITGPGGLGKSHTVMQTLKDLGMDDTSLVGVDGREVESDKYPEDDPDIEYFHKSNNSYVVIKGYSTPKGLYRILYEHRNNVIVFDDCDSVLKDAVSLNLLKGALDSYSRRIISWRSESKDDDLPSAFEFKGRVIFISNLPSQSMDQAIISRSMAVDLSMTPQQKIERMAYLLEQVNFLPEYSDEHKIDALELIETLCDQVKELSLRTLIQVTKIRKAGGENWRNLAEYTIAG